MEDDLETMAGGSGPRAAGILVAAHLLPGVVLAGLWCIGLLAIFDDRRWIPAWIAVIFGVAAVLGLFLRFGFWGTPATTVRATATRSSPASAHGSVLGWGGCAG